MTGHRTPVRGVALFMTRRLSGTLLLLVVISFLVFCLLYLEPGDIARNLLGTRQVTPQTLAEVRAQYHLEDPLPLQYWTWLTNAMHGDFGISVRTQDPVAHMITSRLGLTIEMVVISFVLAMVGGIPAGVWAAVRRNQVLDRAVVGSSVVFISAPAFALGLLLLYVFAQALGWFPVYGTGVGTFDRLWHLALPSLTLALGLGAFIVKITRAAVIHELEQDYVVFARARGLAARQTLALAMRNAAIPVLTSLGLAVAYLFGSTILVEATFSLPGLGSLLEDSVLFKDIPTVQALTLLVAAVIAVTALLVDLTYLLFDPRLRTQLVSR
ncbi:ABC transporter permease [Segeticoccus rhizosphaerae]|uniref:ABC transporter permease n=1 Tax=Segeticoccus rhizosphaerae TaxID=1104777 RepID=UPI001EE49AC3|nr:ABC transporter permease [Ornithinicoccus soli]